MSALSALLPVVRPDVDVVTPCAVDEDDLWFSQRPSVVEQAKALCSGCPVAQTCLSDALARREPWGVWGGQLVERGRVVPRKRPMGRPRKQHATGRGVAA